MKPSICREEITKLHDKYSKDVVTYLDFCLRYLDFYIAMLSAILAAAIAGILQYELPYPSGFIFLAGPVLIVILARLGYKNVLVFYRRFIEAWITTYNLETILGFRGEINATADIGRPPFPSKANQGFIAEFERPQVRFILDRANEEKWDAERLLDELVKIGDTLTFARRTFRAFEAGALASGAVIIIELLGGARSASAAL